MKLICAPSNFYVFLYSHFIPKTTNSPPSHSSVSWMYFEKYPESHCHPWHGSSVTSWAAELTWVCRFIMSASISELDSLNSLISLFSCLMSSSLSRTEQDRHAAKRQIIIQKIRTISHSTFSSCYAFWLQVSLVFTGKTDVVAAVCFTVENSILTLISYVLIFISWL